MIPFDPVTVPLTAGISLVEASAGTGKTHSIALTVIRLLLDQDESGADRVASIGKILVVTFTNAATDELITRARALLRDAFNVFTGVTTETKGNEALFALLTRYGRERTHRLAAALASLDQLSIFTIHGFCKRVLEESALESGTSFDTGFIEDEALLIDGVTQDWWRRTIYENPTLAALAVHHDWRYDAFVSDLNRKRRWPGTRIEPNQSLADAIALLDESIAAFNAVWNADKGGPFLASLSWYAGSFLTSAEHQEEIVAAATALGTGDRAAACAVARELGSAAFLDSKKGLLKKSKAIYDAGPNAFVAAADGIGGALAGIHRALRVSCLEAVERCFDAEKRRQNLLGFDDLLRRLHDALTAQGPDGQLALAIRARYQAALIDEFQDTDPYQFPIFKTAFAGRPLFLIGDPKQAIYGFRGADVFAYMAAAKSAARQYTLSTNWRSTPNMVAAVNGLFGRQPSAFLFDSIGYTPATAARALEELDTVDNTAALHWWFVPLAEKSGVPAFVSKGEAMRAIHVALAKEVVRLLSARRANGDRIRPASIAVLVRTSFQGEAIRRVLRQVNVPSIVAGLGDILESPELRDLEWLLHAVAASQNGTIVRAALTTELWGMHAADIERLSQPDAEDDWQRLTERLAEARQTWSRRGFMRMIQELLIEHRAAERLLAHEDGERRLTNLRHAVELLHHVSVDGHLSPEGLLLWIARARTRKSEDSERTELRLESDEDAVQIVTIHKSKGLEYDIVFCPDIWDARRTAPDESVLVHLPNDGGVVFDHGSDQRAERGRLESAEQLAEDLRIAYVALTRARYRCYVAWGPIANKQTKIDSSRSSLGYLLRATHAAGAPVDVAERVCGEMSGSLGDWEKSLDALVAASSGTMTKERIDADGTGLTIWQPPATVATVPSIRDPLPTAAQLRSWRISSFTSFTAGRHSDDGRDVSDSGFLPVDEETRARRGQREDFLAFPAGRQAGIALHELFERADFAAPVATIRPVASELLRRARLADDDADLRIDAAAAMVERVVSSVLPGTTFSLRDVPHASTLREWDFHLPLGPVGRQTLSDIFANCGGDVARRYAPTLASIDIDRAHGFLTGVVDLAFRRDDKWYVADWKSNHLGYDAADYAAPALERDMVRSHYVLQYHIYVAALHRFLKIRQPRYDYDAHFGGVFYAFLRGFDGARTGWFSDRPSRSFIDAFDALLDAPVESDLVAVHA